MIKFYPDYYYSDDVRIFFKTNVPKEELEDASDVLVFNYGLVCSNAHWEKQVEYFHSLNKKIVLHDYRFHFSSSGTNNLQDCSFENMAKDTLGLINHLKLKDCILLGHSMGVNVCLEMARIDPSKLKRMILISGTVLPPQDVMFDSNVLDITLPYIVQIKEMVPKIFDSLWKNSYKNPIIRKMIHAGGFNVKQVPDSFIEIYMKKIAELTPELFLRLFQEMHDHDIITDLENIKVPCLIIGGDKDKIIPNYLQRILKKYLTNSKLYIVKDGSHVPQWDFPETMNERMLKFIEAS